MIRRSLIVPVYKNEENIDDLLMALRSLHEQVEQLEFVLVVDGSPDASEEQLRRALPEEPYPSQLVSHSRNFGSFAAVRTGLTYARGVEVAVMAADLQEPPELVVDFFRRIARGDADIVFGVREDRKDPRMTRFLAATYWRLYRRFVVPDIPAGGVDVFACNAKVRDAVLDLGEANSSLVAQLFWVGFRREFVTYSRRDREKGTSAWSMRRRLRYMADSVFAFSDLPILALLWFGILGVAFSLAIGTVTLVARLAGAIDTPGFATIIIVVTFLFSLLMTTQGIIGMYLWRAFENTKAKPSAIVMDEQSWDRDGVQG